MSRKYVDCRDTPNIVGCTLAMSGEEAELMEAAVAHSIAVHQEQDSPELREGIRSSWVDEPQRVGA